MRFVELEAFRPDPHEYQEQDERAQQLDDEAHLVPFPEEVILPY